MSRFIGTLGYVAMVPLFLGGAYVTFSAIGWLEEHGVPWWVLDPMGGFMYLLRPVFFVAIGLVAVGGLASWASGLFSRRRPPKDRS